MAQYHSPRRVRASRIGSLIGRLVLGAILCGSSYGLLTGAAVGPAYGTVEPDARDIATASISRSGADVIITGSVANLFENQSFIGPNRAMKQDRPRISVDVADFSKAFEPTRARLAALRNGTEGKEAVSETIAVASLSPADATAALSAIDAIAPDQSIPMPAAASDQLAYARANAPVSETRKAVAYSEKELWCMATAIYFEARGESYRGQVAVAQVVMNRLHHRLYPNTICGVVFQNQQKRNACQFSFACDGRPETVTDTKSWAQAEEIAEKVTSGELFLTEVGNATHYHATYVYPDWAPRMTKLTKIGLHVFYRFKTGWRFG